MRGKVLQLGEDGREKVRQKKSSLGTILHSWNDESIEAKTRWFQSLSMEERLQVWGEFMDMILSINPNVARQNIHVDSTAKRIRIISKI